MSARCDWLSGPYSTGFSRCLRTRRVSYLSPMRRQLQRLCNPRAADVSCRYLRIIRLEMRSQRGSKVAHCRCAHAETAKHGAGQREDEQARLGHRSALRFFGHLLACCHQIIGYALALLFGRDHAAIDMDLSGLGVDLANLGGGLFVERPKRLVFVREVRIDLAPNVDLREAEDTIEVRRKELFLKRVDRVIEGAQFGLCRGIETMWRDAEQLDQRDAAGRRHVLLSLRLQLIERGKRGRDIRELLVLLVDQHQPTVVARVVEEIGTAEEVFTAGG